MNYEQVAGLIRQFLPVIGGVAIAFGWLTKDQVGTLVTNIAAATGPIMIIVSMVWSLVNKTDKNIVAAAAATLERVDPAQGKIITNAPELRDLVTDPAVPNVVPAPTRTGL